jgi:hypothetical protein
MRRPLLLAALLLAVVASPSRAAVPSVEGADISWPNCPIGMGIPERPTEGRPMPLDTARFVVLGLTNGPGFTPNPCLASQVAWVRAHGRSSGAYAVTTYPTSAQLAQYGGHGPGLQRLFRAGAAEANVNLRTMRAAHLATPMVWVDVEPVKVRPWSATPARNNAVIDGAVAAYKAAGLRVGFYSYAYGWRQITGGRRLPTYPTWVPSGNDQRASALRKCSVASFSGGPVLLAQWTVAQRDRNVTCPSYSSAAQVRRMFAG